METVSDQAITYLLQHTGILDPPSAKKWEKVEICTPYKIGIGIDSAYHQSAFSRSSSDCIQELTIRARAVLAIIKGIFV
jgi:hypothetical protein